MIFWLEVVTVPVSDVDQAKAFHAEQLGFNVEQDVQVDERHRFVELQPPGSPCSIALTMATSTLSPARFAACSSTSRTPTRRTPSCVTAALRCPTSRRSRGAASASSLTRRQHLVGARAGTGDVTP
jgi:hypothetical protein